MENDLNPLSVLSDYAWGACDANAILSGPQTHVVNSASNTLTALSRPLLERPAAADIFGMARGLREGVRKGLEAFQTELPIFGPTKLEIPTRARQAIKAVKEKRIKDLFNKARLVARQSVKAPALGLILREEGREGLIQALSPFDLGQ